MKNFTCKDTVKPGYKNLDFSKFGKQVLIFGGSYWQFWAKVGS